MNPLLKTIKPCGQMAKHWISDPREQQKNVSKLLKTNKLCPRLLKHLDEAFIIYIILWFPS